MKEEEILKMNETGEFIPYQESYLKLLFEFRNAVDMYGE